MDLPSGGELSKPAAPPKNSIQGETGQNHCSYGEGVPQRPVQFGYKSEVHAALAARQHHAERRQHRTTKQLPPQQDCQDDAVGHPQLHDDGQRDAQNDERQRFDDDADRERRGRKSHLDERSTASVQDLPDDFSTAVRRGARCDS